MIMLHTALFGDACTSVGDAAALAAVAHSLACLQQGTKEAHRAATAAAAALEAAPTSLWLPPSAAEALRCEVLPRLAKRADALAQVLQDAAVLQVLWCGWHTLTTVINSTSMRTC